MVLCLPWQVLTCPTLPFIALSRALLQLAVTFLHHPVQLHHSRSSSCLFTLHSSLDYSSLEDVPRHYVAQPSPLSASDYSCKGYFSSTICINSSFVLYSIRLALSILHHINSLRRPLENVLMSSFPTFHLFPIRIAPCCIHYIHAAYHRLDLSFLQILFDFALMQSLLSHISSFPIAIHLFNTQL